MSPRRSIESRAWWKSCHIWARRSTGWLTRPAKMLKATSSPTVQVAVDHQLGAEVQDRRRHQLADQLDRVAGGVAQAERPGSSAAT